jgi:hypothetical protein
MAEIGVPVRRRVLVPETIPAEPSPYPQQPKRDAPAEQPVTLPEKVPADDYNATDDFARSIEEAYRVIRERKQNGGPGWGGWE